MEKPGSLPTYQLLAAQQDIFLDQQVFKNVPLYNIGGYVDFNGELDMRTLVDAHRQLMKSADAFSLRIRVSHQGVVQHLGDPPESLDLVDFSDATDAETVALERIKESYARSFQFDDEPSFRSGLIKLSAVRYWYYGIAHHVFLDGWGFSNWAKALVDIYRQLQETGGADLQAVPFLSLLPEEAQYARSLRYSNDKRYWNEKFQTLPPKLLTEKYHRKSERSTAVPSGRASLTLGQRCFEEHKAFAQSQGGSAAQLYLTALYIYFSRVSGCTDIVFGIPTHNRRTWAAKQVIGTTLSFCPTRLSFPGEIAGAKLLAEIIRVQRHDMRHQRYPLGHLHTDLGLRSSHLSRLFDISFNYQLLDYTFEIEGVSGKAYYLTNGFEQTPLTFTICDYGPQQDVELQLDYNLAYLSKEEAELLISRWLLLVEQLIVDSMPTLDQYNLLCDGDRKLLRHFNGEVSLETDEDFFSLFEKRAKQNPRCPAVEFGDRALDYGQLLEAVDSAAARLTRLGIGSGSRVGVCLPRSEDLLTVLMAVVRTGACYVPMDPEFPAKRLALMCEVAELDLVVVGDDFGSRLPTLGDRLDGRVVTLDGLKQIQVADADFKFPSLAPDDSAYILFTSGSTGVPKGVEVSHRALSNLLLSMSERPGLGAEDRLLAVTTVSFDIAGLELYLPLVVGGTVVIADSQSVRNGYRLNELVARKRITAMQATPSTWQIMLEAGWPAGVKIKAFCGGESLPDTLAIELLERTTSLWNMYGPTETTIWSCVHQVVKHERISIGRPIRNTEIYLLDENLQQLPVGERGLLYIGGEGLAKGYYKRPDLTVERFVDWQNEDGTGRRIYNTGDIARLGSDGNLEYLGRSDYQIKLRGFRIETADVESAIASFPGIVDCLVDLRARQSSPGNAEHLVAYYTAEVAIDEGSLRTHLADFLPGYMIPTAYLRLDRFALTLNGKKDRSALPQPLLTASARADRVPAKNELEARIASVWCDILGTEDLSVEQNVFELGATSLDMVRAGKLLEERLDTPLTTINLFEFPNVRALANYLANVAPLSERNEPQAEQVSAGKNRLLARRTRISYEAAVS